MTEERFLISGCLFECYGAHRDLHVLTHSFPTLRSSDLISSSFRPGYIESAGAHTHSFTTASKGGGEAHPIVKLRSEEHTSELQSLMRISYAVFCLKKKTTRVRIYHTLTNADIAVRRLTLATPFRTHLVTSLTQAT